MFMRLLEFWLSDRMLVIGTAGFLAGYLVMENVEFQLVWLLLTCLPAGIALFRRTRGDGLTDDSIFRLAMVFLAWNLAVGLARNWRVFGIEHYIYPWEFVAGSLLLPVFLWSVWRVCREPGGATTLLITLACCGLVAGICALYDWRMNQAVDTPGARLRNPLVHGGQHPVGTAITFAFCIVSAGTLYGKAGSKFHRITILAGIALVTLAVMLTLSRGALLALASVPLAFALAGAGAVIVARIRRQPVRPALRSLLGTAAFACPPMLTALTVCVGFQFVSSSLLPALPGYRTSGLEGAEVIYEKVGVDPLNEYLLRGLNGRQFFYRFGLERMDRWDKHLAGTGLWAPEIELEKVTGAADHFHSIYVATYIHGGIIGGLMLAAILLLGVRRALALVRAGEPQWLALLAYGLGGLIFDGQSACSLVTHPRFENLILWFPLIAVAARWRSVQAGRQLSSSESR